jgi:hypothetical protein
MQCTGLWTLHHYARTSYRLPSVKNGQVAYLYDETVTHKY